MRASAAAPSSWGARLGRPDIEPFALIDFDVVVNVAEAALWFAAQDGIDHAEGDGIFGTSSDVSRLLDGELFGFLLGWGDCPAGCIYQDWRYVVRTIEGPVEVSAPEAYELLFASHDGGMGPVRDVVGAGRLDALALPEEGMSGDFYYTVERDGADGSIFGDYRVSVRLDGCAGPCVYEFKVEDNGAIDALAGERRLDGWLLHSSFGWCWDASYPWIWHPDHGWFFVWTKDATSSFWIFDSSLGWSYWGRGFYPWMYARDSWLYYVEGSTAPREFYDPASGTYVDFD